MKPNPKTEAGRQRIFQEALALAYKHYGVVLPEIRSKLRFPDYVRARGDVARHLYAKGVIPPRIAELLGLDRASVMYHLYPRYRERNRESYRRRRRYCAEGRQPNEAQHAQTKESQIEFC